MIPESFIEEVLSRTDIVQVIGRYVKLQHKGSNWMACCPFHKEKTPSFAVNPSKQFFKCFGCGEHGTAITFLMKFKGLSFPEAIKELADDLGMEVPEDRQAKIRQARAKTLTDYLAQAADFYHQTLFHDRHAIEYLKGRGITEETVNKFQLGLSPDAWQGLEAIFKDKAYDDPKLEESGLVIAKDGHRYDRFRSRVMYPIRNPRGQVIGFGARTMVPGEEPKYLNSPETMLFDKSRNLYGLNYARTSRKPYMIICEGYMDVIAMHQAGFTNAVASLGTAFTTQHSVLLKRYTQEVRLAYDSDGAGQKAALRAIPILKSAGINVRVIHMDPYKDPDEFIKNLGTEAFQERIDAAESSFMFEISVLEKNYKQSDPEGRASFMKAMARRLLEFPQELERNIYIDAIAGRYGIAPEELKRMVNSFGASMSREQVEAAIYQQQEREEMPAKKRVEKEDSVLTAQKFFLTWLIEEPSIYDKTKDYINEDDFVEPLSCGCTCF